MTSVQAQKIQPIRHRRMDRPARLHQTASLIGRTPLHPFESLSPNPDVIIMGKMEWLQLGGSVKARAAFRIIDQILQSNGWKPGQRLLDASSGNTGIAYGAIAASLGIPVTLCLPQNASKERKKILQSLGVEVILTDPMGGTDSAQEFAQQLVAEEPEKYVYMDQYKNPNNWQAHFYTTAHEIFQQTSGALTHFVCGLGTTGSFVGNGRAFKQMKDGIQLVALQPNGPMHGLEGWKDLETAIVPGIYDASIADEMLQIPTEEAYDMIRFIARHEGILLSPSSAANIVGAKKIADSLKHGQVITLLPDNADKYIDILTQITSPSWA